MAEYFRHHKAAFDGLRRTGYLPFSPILATVWFQEEYGPGPKNWMDYDLRMLERCDALYLIHNIKEVENGTGVQLELDAAAWAGIPVYTSLPPSHWFNTTNPALLARGGGGSLLGWTPVGAVSWDHKEILAARYVRRPDRPGTGTYGHKYFRCRPGCNCFEEDPR